MTIPETGPAVVFVVEIIGHGGQRDHTLYEHMEQALRAYESAVDAGAWSRVLAYEPARVVEGPASWASGTPNRFSGDQPHDVIGQSSICACGKPDTDPIHGVVA